MAKAAVATKPWWMSPPTLIVASVTAIGAVGTFIVKSAEYIKLPEAVAEQSKRNDTQDSRLDKLITLQEYQQQQQAPNQMAYPVSHGLREYDGETCWECPLTDRDQCFDRQEWRACE